MVGSPDPRQRKAGILVCYVCEFSLDYLSNILLQAAFKN